MPTKKTASSTKSKEDFIRVRVDKDQKRQIQQAADRVGLDLSSWVRMVALKAAELEK